MDWDKLLSSWMELSLDPDRFWRLTPKQIKQEMEARLNVLQREHNERAWVAWHIAALSRQKTLPKLSKLQVRVGEKARQTPKEIASSLRVILAAHGGSKESLEKLNGW